MSSTLITMQKLQAGLRFNLQSALQGSVQGGEVPEFPVTNVPMHSSESANPPVQNVKVSTCTKCKKVLDLRSFLGKTGKVRKTCQSCANVHNASKKRLRLKAAATQRREAQVATSEAAPSIEVSGAGNNVLPNVLRAPMGLWAPRFKPRVESLTTMSGTELSSNYWSEAEDRHLDDLGDDFIYELESKIWRAVSMKGEPKPTSPPLAQPYEGISLANVFRSVDLKVDLLRYDAPTPQHANTPVARLEAAIIRLALVTRLREVAARWRTDRGKDARKDFFREVGLIHTQFQAGLLRPWAPLAEWFQYYAIAEARYWTGRTIRGGVDGFGCIRQLVLDLQVRATIEWDTADAEMKILCGVLSVPNVEEELETQIQWMNKQVHDDCESRGCLLLGQILTEGMIREAKFSEKWVMDTESSRGKASRKA